MQSQRNELIRLAERNGWKVIQTDNFEAHVISNETWLLESEWSPIGLKAYVTFPIDEQDYRSRTAWAIRVEKNVLAPDSEIFFCSLNEWKAEKDNFITALNKFRLESAQ